LPAVIVPVFNAPEELDGCLASIRETAPSEASVVVIDDASTDPETRKVLAKWQSEAGGSWQFMENTVNVGFVGTVNRGMEATSGNVVLLNSDTVVTPGWLEGLRRCLDSDPSIATATPWTNNGEIASIPRFCQDNPVPENPAQTARVIANAGRATYPDLPTAVGFCMAISRRALRRVGLFDVSTFGAGYGEENDFSMRVSRAGFRNVLCDDVYVAHLGGRSFGPLGLRPNEETMNRLLKLHPDYLDRVMQFIRDDPLKSRRDELIEALETAAAS
jgi:GT2 family glycosyltransferase